MDKIEIKKTPCSVMIEKGNIEVKAKELIVDNQKIS